MNQPPVITEKTFEGYLILDYRKGKFRVTSKQPKKTNLKGTELPIKMVFKVKVPEVPTYTANAEITLSQDQVDSLVIEAL